MRQNGVTYDVRTAFRKDEAGVNEPGGSGAYSVAFVSVAFAVLFLFFSLVIFPEDARAQRGDDFLIANDYLRNGQYEEAYRIFARLLRQNPDSHPVYDRAVTSLVSLKRFDEAVEITKDRLRRIPGDIVTQVRLGELYHMAGDTENAFASWQQTIDQNINQPQVYRYIAETLSGRREFEKSLSIYYQARENLNTPTLFGNEIARSLLVLGRFEPGMQEYVNLLMTSPMYAPTIQRQLIQYDDRDLYDAAIVTLDEATASMLPGHEAFSPMRGLLIWMLMERQLYRRALVVARNLERSGQEGSLTVFNLGTRLKNAGQFELAEQAFAYYLDGDDRELRAMAGEETARLYMDWADYLITNNLDFGSRSDSLYRSASHTIETIEKQHTRYDRKLQVLALQVELALNYLKDVALAEEYLGRMRPLVRSDNEQALADYLQGRIDMFRGSFMQARVYYTRANRTAAMGDMADRSRYYLALNDFYNGDFEYAGLQMRPLQRQSTSLFANNALRLRLWISEGLAADSNATDLRIFAKARHQYEAGDREGALQALMPYLTNTSPMPVKDEAVLLASSIIRRTNPGVAMGLLAVHMNRGIAWASRERVMWEKARLADLIHRRVPTSDDAGSGSINQIAGFVEANRAGTDTAGFRADETLTIDRETVISLYENMLIEHPTGFYAQVARERIRELLE
jgi:tetratricopeptide (TPR) repeat protein